MAISIQTASPSDLHALATAAFSASQDDKLTQVICRWPAPGSGTWEHYDEDLAYQKANLGQWFRKLGILVSKAVDTQNGLIVGFCIWNNVTLAKADIASRHDVPPDAPLPPWGDAGIMESSNLVFHNLYRGCMGFKNNVAVVQDIDVIPSYRGQGIARKLMQAGLDLIDQAGQDTYLEATKKMQHMFGELGFEALKEAELMDGYFQTAMYRKARKAEVAKEL